MFFAILFEAVMEAVRLDDAGYTWVNVLWQSLWPSIVLVTVVVVVEAVRRRRS